MMNECTLKAKLEFQKRLTKLIEEDAIAEQNTTDDKKKAELKASLDFMIGMQIETAKDLRV